MDAPELHTAEIGRSDLTRARNFSRSAAATTVASTRTGNWYLLTNSAERVRSATCEVFHHDFCCHRRLYKLLFHASAWWSPDQIDSRFRNYRSPGRPDLNP
jgi:hypothetical protein